MECSTTARSHRKNKRGSHAQSVHDDSSARYPAIETSLVLAALNLSIRNGRPYTAAWGKA